MKKAGLISLVLVMIPALAQAALVNINTADAALLDTLPGIGATYAARIVDYRTAHGPFASIGDIQNVSGIGPSTFAEIKPFITVSDTASAASTATETATSAPHAATTYTPPSPSLSVEIVGSDKANIDVPLSLTARITTKSGAVDPSAQVLWSFGDGSSVTGTTIEKTYRYPGTYLVTATASDGATKAQADLTVTAQPVQVRMLPVTGEGVTLANDANERLDLSGWRLLSDTGSFRFPEGTAILPGGSVLFPSTITNLPFESTMALLYPDGIVAARPSLPAQPTVQLLSTQAGSNGVQEARPDEQARQVVLTSGAANSQSHVEAVLAPAAAVEPAAAGAPVAKAAAKGLFHSPWTLGLLGVMAAAGGAFIFL